ncbi:MAG: formylglycine-generating enzyme family protein [Phycisphaerales bacterium]
MMTSAASPRTTLRDTGGGLNIIIWKSSSRALGAILAGAALSGAPVVAVEQPAPGRDGATPVDAPFVETIPGTVVSIEMVPIPGGVVEVGADGEAVEVEVDPFWIAATEIPWDAYDIFVFKLDEADSSNDGADAVTRPSKPYLPMDRGFGHNGYPAISMSYEGAAGFCEWLSAKTGRHYRLPTEAEWEYAVRAGATNNELAARLDELAWHRGNAKRKSHPIKSKAPNEWGVYHGLGGVAEWVTGHDGEPVTAGGHFLMAPEAISPDTRESRSDGWNASDPQIPKSEWWMADCPFVGFRIVCVPDARANEQGDQNSSQETEPSTDGDDR